MRSMLRLTSITLLLSGALAVSGCETPAKGPQLQLTAADRTHAPDPAEPAIPQLRAVTPGSPEAGERFYLLDALIKPALAFSVAQEATIAAERQRADGLVAKIDAYNAAVRPKRRLLPP